MCNSTCFYVIFLQIPLDKFAIQLNDVLPLDSMLEIEVAPERILVFLDGATEGA